MLSDNWDGGGMDEGALGFGFGPVSSSPAAHKAMDDGLMIWRFDRDRRWLAVDVRGAKDEDGRRKDVINVTLLKSRMIKKKGEARAAAADAVVFMMNLYVVWCGMYLPDEKERDRHIDTLEKIS